MQVQVAAVQAAPEAVRAFIQDYFDAWKGTDEHKILAYYSDDVVIHLPTGVLEGKTAVRDNFVGPFIAGFPGNVHSILNLPTLRTWSQWNGVLRPCTKVPLPVSRQRAKGFGSPAAPSTNTISEPEGFRRDGFTSILPPFCGRLTRERNCNRLTIRRSCEGLGGRHGSEVHP